MQRFLHERQPLNVLVPALVGGIIAWSAFTLVGSTPLIRASALALVIVGVALTLTRWGAPLAVAGGLALAFSPAFWSQTGGSDSLELPIVAGAIALALLVTVFTALRTHHPVSSIAVGIVLFSGLFLSVFGTPRSLRLTTLLAAWLIFLLVDALMVTNPRPEEAPPALLRIRHVWGMLLILMIGVLNDPLFVLMIPAVALGLFLSKANLPWWYWGLMLGTLLVGARGMAIQYMDSDWWLYPAAQAEALNIRVPYMMADGWRDASRWIYLLGLAIEQFTPFGMVLAILGLARLSRWYPPLGVVTMVAYGTYFLFGLVYFGKDSAVLLLPLMIIQVIWITYAVHSFGQWLQRSATPFTRWVAPAAFTLLPLFLLLRIVADITK